MGFISLSFFKLNKNERKWQNFKACPGPFTSLSHKEECWNNVYFSGPFNIFLALLFGSWDDTLTVSVLLLQYHHEAIYLKRVCLFCHCFEKTQEKTPFYLYALLKSISLFFVLCFLLDSDFILIRKASGAILGHLKFVYHMNWVNHGRMTFSFSPHCWISLKLQLSIWAAQALVHSSKSLFFILGTCI